MAIVNIGHFDENTIFKSLGKGYQTFNEVFERIIDFIKEDTNSSYKISIGTDSQVSSRTVFVSCIHVHRVGKGAIGFLHKDEIMRCVKNLREKIYLETSATLQLACLFDNRRIMKIKSAVGKKGVSFEFHIDIGKKGETKSLINEMTGMVRGLYFIPKIKPESYCASCFADRYTKAI
jgi:uncharacterized protein